MSWNDGITKEMSEYLDGLSDVGTKARKVGEQVIDEEVREFSNRVVPKIPVKTGGLKAAYKETKITDNGKNWYGYEVGFEGNAPNGESYEKIANIQNYGTPRRAGSFFITNAVKKLKGMSDRIEARIEAEISKRTE